MTSEGVTPYPYVPMPTALLLDENLSDAAKILWTTLYQFSLTGGGGTFEMSQEEMMELTRAAKASVVKRKKELIEAGWLDETALRGLGRTNLYTVKVPGTEVGAEA